MENRSIIEELIYISKQKKALMQNIFDLTNRQKEFLKLNKIQTVIKQIDLKDKYISEVDKLDMRFYNLFSKLKSNLGIDSIDKIDTIKYPQMRELKKVVAEILKLTEEIQTVDNGNIDDLKKDIGALSNKLKGVRQGKKVSNAYGAYKKQVTSIFLDKKK